MRDDELPEPSDTLFRSHFERVNQTADRAYEHVRPAYLLGHGAAADSRYAGRPFEEVEQDLEAGWLNVRVGNSPWAAVRDFAREGFERGRPLGFVADATPASSADSGQRPSYADPLADAVDPTAPDSPEQTG